MDWCAMMVRVHHGAPQGGKKAIRFPVKGKAYRLFGIAFYQYTRRTA